MSNLKDTDIDDLFRRASDKYPLRTDSSDWDRMAAALEKDPPPNEPADPDNSDRRRRRFIWLFLLLPLGGLGYYTWHQAGHTPAITRVRTGKTQDHQATNPADKASTQTDAATPAPGTTASTPGTAASTPGTTASTPGTATPSGTTPSAVTPSATTPATAAGATIATPTTGASITSTPSGTAKHPTSTNRTTNRTTAGTIHNDNPGNGTTGGDITHVSSTHAPRTPTHRSTRLTPVADAFTLRTSDINEQRAGIARNYNLTVNVKAPEIQKDTTAPKKKASAPKKSSYLYAGILGAPDLSTVKMQSVKGVGATFGILLGYAINDHWAVETGISVDRKRYYTDGEYFDTTHVKLPKYSYLENVDGTCYMWEIPLNVRYNFNPGGKTKWFATAGFSTYLMTREKYNYKYGWTTWPGSADSFWNIKKPSQYPFSVINLSAGFEQRLGKVGNLRIEPYVRLPLGGIGTGKLPIMSAGVNIGITRRLW